MKKIMLVATMLSMAYLASLGKITPQKYSSKAIYVDSTKGLDPETGLVIAKELDMVKAQCTSCHSSKMILQFRASREGWLERIRWMQRTQKLWDLGEAEPIVLDYLSKYYGPVKHAQRRQPLSNIQWYKLN
ncbi:hypothetical protein [Flectobacillus rivi]|uniref:Monoheme cytochrome C n=1 Tax=Flectobacillus rivi TaxID=2984209 RepID=A0ABT6YYT1_9BACT|nr:hypothetical protein [Flectobacillus rivi]MDI9873973.1 hypothetical protein [Flectobacillus rivi]